MGTSDSDHDESAPTLAAPIPPGARALDRAGSSDDDEPRYETVSLLGAGGMGEVHLVRDTRLGREVARKTVSSAHGAMSEARARFVREARIQGRLEHPCIVPVYELGPGRHPDFFTMKRVRGNTLDEILRGLRKTPGGPDVGMRKLLAAFVSVCQAVDLAHSRGVVHRDIKPANVMLGDFGEVYVLDWGLARELDAAADSLVATAGTAELDVHRTQAGTIIGTPGYLAPELIRRGTALADVRSDVYALGAILFEILVFEPLHPGGTTDELLASTLRGSEARPSVRAPHREVPPELEEVCVKATQRDPDQRCQTVRELVEAVERFLEGDRDLQLRRDLSREHAARAAAAAEGALSGPSAVTAVRTEAIQEVGRALALDPGNAEALGVLVRLLAEPPKELPEPVQRELEDSYLRSVGARARAALPAYLCLALAGAAWVAWMGVRNWLPLVPFLAGVLVAAGVSYRLSLPGARARTALLLGIVGISVALSATGAALGPLVLTPTLLAANSTAFCALFPPPIRKLVIACALLALLGPLLVEWLGLLPASYDFRGSAMVVLPRSLSLRRLPTTAGLTIINALLIVIPSLVAGRVRDDTVRAEERVLAHAWQLRQLVPVETAAQAKEAAR